MWLAAWSGLAAFVCSLCLCLFGNFPHCAVNKRTSWRGGAFASLIRGFTVEKGITKVKWSLSFIFSYLFHFKRPIDITYSGIIHSSCRVTIILTSWIRSRIEHLARIKLCFFQRLRKCSAYTRVLPTPMNIWRNYSQIWAPNRLKSPESEKEKPPHSIGYNIF